VLAAAVLGAVGVVFAGRRFRNWGATKGECVSVLPGDELVPDPADVTTRAVTINAPGREVWRWLVQIGQDRGGLYSYDWIENLFGLRVHSTDEIRPEWQQVRVGDAVRLVPPGWLGLPDGVALPVARIVPGRALVLREDPSRTPWDAVWSFQPRGAPRRPRLARRPGHGPDHARHDATDAARNQVPRGTARALGRGVVTTAAFGCEERRLQDVRTFDL
jgi:hypothetical protein